MLDDIGYGVIEVEDAFRALEVIASPARISILLTDQAMPGLTGMQLAEAAKKLRPRLPVILASGYAELPKDAQGILRRLAKPYRLAELLDAIAAGLEKTE